MMHIRQIKRMFRNIGILILVLAANSFATNGELDPSFFAGATGTGGYIADYAHTPDGRIVAVGNFSSVDGRSENCLAYIDSVTGRVNGTFGIGSRSKGTAPVGCNGGPNTVAIQPRPGGHFRIIVAGDFANVGDDGDPSHFRSWIAGLTEDGVIDPTFIGVSPLGPDGPISDILVLPDGSVLLAGGLTRLWTGSLPNPTEATVGHLVKLEPDGTFDAAFNNNLGLGFDTTVNKMAVLSTGEIIVGGYFFSVNGITSHGIAKLSSTGVPDAAFSATIGTGVGQGSALSVTDIAVQSNDKVIAVGNFASFNGNSSSNQLVRLFPNGIIDGSLPSFVTSGSSVSSVVLDEPNSKFYLMGNSPRFDDGSTQRDDIAKLDLTSGMIDPAFSLTGRLYGTIISASRVGASDLMIGGAFYGVSGVLRSGFALLDDHGVLNTTFTPTINFQSFGVKAVKVLPDDKVLVGGSFIGVNGSLGTRLTRLNAGDGSVDTSFVTGQESFNVTDGEVTVIETDLDNSNIVVAGTFATFGGSPHQNIALLDSFGRPYSSFNPSVIGEIKAVAVQSDHKIVIAGNIVSVNGISGFGGVARLNADGTTDTNFTPSGTTCFACVVNAVVLDGTGIVIGGTFTDFNGQANVNRIARLNMSNGSLDMAYHTNGGTGFDAAVMDLDIRLGKVTAVGAFTNYNGVAGGRISRISANGSPDPSLDPGTGFDNTAEKITIRTDGTMIVMGNFITQFNGHQTWRGVAKIKPNGTFDDTFIPVDSMRPGTHNGTLYDVGAQAIGGDIVVGLFNEWGWNPSIQYGIPRFGIVRLTDTSANVWKPEGTFQAASNDSLPGDQLGCSVAITGIFAVVGSCSTNQGTADAFVYDRNGDGTWTLAQELRTTGAPSSNRKTVVAADGGTILVGSPNKGTGGRVAVFARLNDTWSLRQELDGGLGDRLGTSLDVFNSVFWAGTPGYENGRGAIQKYIKDPMTGTWNFDSRIAPSDLNAPFAREFGASLAAIPRLVIGAPGTPVNGEPNRGVVFVKNISLNPEDPEFRVVWPEDGQPNDRFGESVSSFYVDESLGHRWAAGAPGVQQDRGAFYTFSPAGTSDLGLGKINNPLGQPGSRFGAALAGAFRRIGVGCPRCTQGVVSSQGAAFVYESDSPTIPTISHTIPAPASVSNNGSFSGAMAFNAGLQPSTNLIMGASLDDPGGVADGGSAHIYTLEGSAYTHRQKVELVDDTGDDEFGSAVAIDDDWAVMGAPGDDIRGATDQGSVYVYHGVPADFYYGALWTFKQKLIATDGSAVHRFGQSVAFGARILVVGAPGSFGAAYVYKKTTGNTPWVLLGKINHPEPFGDGFGAHVAAAGDYIFVSAPAQNNSRGAVYVFLADPPNDQINFVAKLTDPSLMASGQFGYGLAASGNVLLVGEPDVDDRKGAVIPFKRNGAFGSYIAQPKIFSPDGVAGDRFGEAISISGDQALISSPTADVDGMADRGAVYAFQVNGAGTPIFLSKLTAFDGAAGDNFGISVSISGDAAIIGASLADPSSHVDQGAAYTFERARGVWAEKNKLVDPQGSAGDEMGKAVAVSGPAVLVGARNTNILPGRPAKRSSIGNQPNGGVFAYGFAPIAAPTASHVAIGGRVTTSTGLGVNRSIVTLTDQAGNVRRVLTGSFGNYRFDDVEAGQTYIVSITSKRYIFATPSRVISVGDDALDLDFTALPDR